MYNLTSIEVHFATSAIAKLFPKSLYVAMGNSGDGNFEVGFCARTNAFVAAGHDFNGQAWKPGRAVYSRLSHIRNSSYMYKKFR